MPLPTDTKTLEQSTALLELSQKLAGGPHAGIRPAHAKGLLLEGTFTPTDAAKKLSVAQHFNSNSTPVIARFSSSTGIPALPDTDANGKPRGLAVRFVLATTPRRAHTDILAISTPVFFASTPDEAIAFFSAVAEGTVPQYAATQPKAAAFLTTPKPWNASFENEQFYAIHAFKLINADGKATFIRYRWVPVAGLKELSDEEVSAKGPNWLFDNAAELVATRPVKFKLVAQIAEDGDVTNDGLVRWPEDRKLVELGTLELTSVMPDNAANQKNIIFDPIPRTNGVEASDDPLLETRAGIYLLSGRQRRAA